MLTQSKMMYVNADIDNADIAFYIRVCGQDVFSTIVGSIKLECKRV